jgi:hypothetical protein
MPHDGDYDYGSITLYVDGEEVLGMFVRREWANEWAHWQFSIVDFLTICPWTEGFLDFHNRLRSINENESKVRNDNCVCQ